MDDSLKKKLLVKEGRTLRVFNAPKGSGFDSTAKTGADVVLAFVANKTDISRDHGWDSLNARGWHPVTLVAIDDTWSALRFKHAPELGKERAKRVAARAGAKKSTPKKGAKR